jgi:hypothetical protein
MLAAVAQARAESGGNGDGDAVEPDANLGGRAAAAPASADGKCGICARANRDSREGASSSHRPPPHRVCVTPRDGEGRRLRDPGRRSHEWIHRALHPNAYPGGADAPYVQIDQPLLGDDRGMVRYAGALPPVGALPPARPALSASRTRIMQLRIRAECSDAAMMLKAAVEMSIGQGNRIRAIG